MSETPVFADAERLDGNVWYEEEFLKELFWRKQGEFNGERELDDRVDSFVSDQLDILRRGANGERGVCRGENLLGVW